MHTLLLIIVFLVSAEPLLNLPMESQAMPTSTKCRNYNYQFSQFQEGRVLFKGGLSTKARLNYNLLHGAVMFLNSGGDTLLITNKDRIEHITIGNEVFYCQPFEGDFQLVARYKKVLLVQKKQLALMSTKSSASDQKYTAGSESDIPGSLLLSYQDGEFRWQNKTSDPAYRLKASYFLIDQNKRLHAANKAGFLKIYGKDRAKLAEYFRENEVNIKDEIALKNLMLFCESFE